MVSINGKPSSVNEIIRKVVEKNDSLSLDDHDDREKLIQQLSAELLMGRSTNAPLQAGRA